MTVIARDDVTLALVTNVASTAHYFQLKASTASAPTIPTAYPAPLPWVTTEPTYMEGATNSLYTVDVTVFSDGSFDYTPVSLSSSYEAAKAAYNKAQQAQSSATSAQTAANLALANAQNMVMNTGSNLDNTWKNNSVTAENGVYTRTFPGNENHVDFLVGRLSGKAIPGHTYSISLDARVDSGNYVPDDNFVFGWSDGWNYVLAHGLSGDWQRFASKTTVGGNGTDSLIFFMSSYMNSDGAKVVQFRNLSIKDITEAQAAQKSADDAQSTADTANTTAKGAQTTADGKNKIFSAASEPAHTGLVPGDMWFQLDGSKNVSGIKVWNGSAFVDMVLLGNELLVASSVGTTQIKDNAIVTGKIAANAVTAINIAAQTITGDKLDVGSVAAAIVTSGKFQTATSGARVVMDSNGISAYDSSNALTFQINAANGNVTSNGGTFTGSTFRTNAGSDRTEMNNSGVTVYKGGSAYAHLGSDTTYGLQAWNPITSNLTDISSMVFGASSIVESSDETTPTVGVAPHTQNTTPWKNLNVIQENGSWKRFRSPSGRFLVIMTIGYNREAPRDFVYMYANVNFRKNNGDISAFNDYSATSTPGSSTYNMFTPGTFIGIIVVEPNVDYSVNMSFKTIHYNFSDNGIDAYGHCNYRRLFIMPV